MIIPCIRKHENVAGVINNKTRNTYDFLQSWINTKQNRILDSEFKKMVYSYLSQQCFHKKWTQFMRYSAKLTCCLIWSSVGTRTGSRLEQIFRNYVSEYLPNWYVVHSNIRHEWWILLLTFDLQKTNNKEPASWI